VSASLPENRTKRYTDLKTYWRSRFGCTVYKLPVDAGFTCPNRDGSRGRGGCIYCDGRGSRLRQEGPLPSVSEQLRRGRDFYRSRKGAKKFIAYFQTFTNTYAPCDQLRRLYDEALALEVQAVAGVPVPPSRLEKIMKVLGRERDSLILGYNEVAPGVATPEGDNATADAVTLNVRIHGAGLKKRLRELGVLGTLSGPMPYVLHLSGVEPSRTKGLAAL